MILIYALPLRLLSVHFLDQEINNYIIISLILLCNKHYVICITTVVAHCCDVRYLFDEIREGCYVGFDLFIGLEVFQREVS